MQGVWSPSSHPFFRGKAQPRWPGCPAEGWSPVRRNIWPGIKCHWHACWVLWPDELSFKTEEQTTFCSSGTVYSRAGRSLSEELQHSDHFGRKGKNIYKKFYFNSFFKDTQKIIYSTHCSQYFLYSWYWYLCNRPYAWWHRLLKFHHHALFTWIILNFLPDFTWVYILFIFAALGISSC